MANETGLYVSHLMLAFSIEDRQQQISSLTSVISKYKSNDIQIITGASFGHESDALVMILAPTPEELLNIEQAIKDTGVFVVDSFFSICETSEYMTTEEEEQARVNALDETEAEKEKMMDTWRHRMSAYKKDKTYPQLPEREFFCFYPMSKKREGNTNWYALSFEERAKYMRAHGALGRKYSGKILQLITGATGLTDWEWGVSLFSNSLSDVKDIVYEMRFDEASALYGEFGHFTIAKICEPENLFS